MKWLMGLLLVSVMLVGGFVLLPAPIDGDSWNAPSPPDLTGVLAPNERLLKAELLGLGDVKGPEDTAIDGSGRLYSGIDDGSIVRIGSEGKVERWINTEGRPLGMVFDKAGNLIIADAFRGLLSVSSEGAITVLAQEAGGEPFGFTDDVDIAPDGRIYFSDASSRFAFDNYRLDLLEMRPHGRLLRYDPDTQIIEVLLANLYFANGVAVSPDGEYVLVNETWKYRVLQYWISGPKAGTSEVFVDNLPGFPDNLAVDGDSRYWLAIPALRDPMVDYLHTQVWIKELLAKLPEALQPTPQPYGLVLGLDRSGKIFTSLHDPGGAHLQELTSAQPHGGYLYFGSLHNDRIGRLPLKAISGPGADE